MGGPVLPQVESKVTLALGGIAVVLGAVFASMGFLALLGQPSSLIILEVVPFLVLAVGADNIFIFVQEYQVGGTGGSMEGVGAPMGVGRSLWDTSGCRDPCGVRGHGGSLGSPWGGLRGSLGSGVPMGHGSTLGWGVPKGDVGGMIELKGSP